MKAVLIFLSVFLLIDSSLLFAEAPNFSVTVVGNQQAQEHYFTNPLAGTDQGFPWITIPQVAKPESSPEPDRATGSHFFVLVRNAAKASIRLNLNSSNWYDCLTFEITPEGGKPFLIHRPPTDWLNNPGEPWIFQPDGCRVLAVNFTLGRWEGLPTWKDIPSRAAFKIRAIFSYYDRETRKLVSFSSALTDAMNGP